MELVAKSWMVRIRRRDGKPDEEQYCPDEAIAWELMDDLNDPDNAEMYRSIALVCIDWRDHKEKVLDTIDFKEETR
ncbi:MAG: hypothetical protein IJ089_13685 [Clostridia bacterium]|nr:hypothetical protein [Clostridia bacterium]MBQ8964816.1 hypothetical protein [Clostridia bacterium]